MKYTVIYENGPTSWGAYVPDVIAVGDSRDEVERLIREAVEFHIEGMREEFRSHLHRVLRAYWKLILRRDGAPPRASTQCVIA